MAMADISERTARHFQPCGKWHFKQDEWRNGGDRRWARVVKRWMRWAVSKDSWVFVNQMGVDDELVFVENLCRCCRGESDCDWQWDQSLDARHSLHCPRRWSEEQRRTGEPPSTCLKRRIDRSPDGLIHQLPMKGHTRWRERPNSIRSPEQR